MIKKALYLAITFYYLGSKSEATIVQGDPLATSGTSFSFSLGFAKYNVNNGVARVWLASNETISNDQAKPYALCYFHQISPEVLTSPKTGEIIKPIAIPMANSGNAQVATYNTETNQVGYSAISNPFYGAKFLYFDTYNNQPIGVVQSQPRSLYYAQDIKRYAQETDTEKNTTDVYVYTFPTGTSVSALSASNKGVFVASAEGTFGTNTSFINQFIIGAAADAKTNSIAHYLQKASTVEISTNTAALRGGGAPLSALGSSVSFGIHNAMNFHAVNLSATADAGGTAAGMALIKTQTQNQDLSMSLEPIALDGVLSSSINTVVSAASGETITISKSTGMVTSTSLHYMIIARYNSFFNAYQIFAVPAVGESGDNYGKVADCTSIKNIFNTTNNGLFVSRFFDTPLNDPQQISIDSFTPYSEQINVGQSFFSTIEMLYTTGDTVYVVTDTGTWGSQAIFAADGHIISWTPWFRVLGTNLPMIYSYINSNSTANFYIANNGTGFNTVYQTQWTLQQNLSTFFQYASGVKGGIQGIFDFNQWTPGFNNSMSMIGTTGYNSVCLGQTGSIQNSIFDIQKMSLSDVVCFNTVAESKALVALELASVGTRRWLFAGGVSGLRVLTDTTGYTHTGTFTSVQDFNQGQTWKTVGNFAYIKKLVFDDSYLYILTPSAIYRISLLDEPPFNQSSNTITPETWLSRNAFQNKVSFLDMIIDNGFMVLGTTQGLFTCSKAQQPVAIPIPQGLPAVTQLFVVSNNATPSKHFADKSNLFVLQSSFHTQQTRLNRFTIQNKIITPFNDALVNSASKPQGVLAPFIQFNQFASSYFTDGSWNIASNYFLGATQPPSVPKASMLQIFAGVKNGKSSTQTIMHLQSSYVPAQYLQTTNNLLGVMRESTSGACITSGNFAPRINA